jgi:hypothetical protein
MENETVPVITDLPEDAVQEVQVRRFNIKKIVIITAVTAAAAVGALLLVKLATADDKNESEHLEITYDSTPVVTPDAA